MKAASADGPPMGDAIEAVLFDLGGVIVELGGLDAFLTRHGFEPETFWPRWLGMGAGHDFERGASSADAFAEAFVAEFGIGITPEQFLDEFAAWPSALYPGALELVAEVPVLTGSLSNTNPIHWDAQFEPWGIGAAFDRHFPSFQLGLAKPSTDIFERVVELLEVPPACVLFLDDNQLNVDGARAAGLGAERVVGPAEARRALESHGVLP